MPPKVHSNLFILEAFDLDLWCPIAQTRFQVADIEALRAIVGEDADGDPELDECYFLDDEQLDGIVACFGLRLDRSDFNSADIEFDLRRWYPPDRVPYLVHSGYELPLLLNGQKKLAIMEHAYPPMTFEGEHCFDHWVAEGVLHREEAVMPVEAPTKDGPIGIRTVYYTPKGEEWRIPANKLLWEAWYEGGGSWNEYFERLSSMLFGYEEWQTDWWIDHLLRHGPLGGMSLCCAVTPAGLAWIVTAGFRALPPVEGRMLEVESYAPDDCDDLYGRLLGNPDHAAVVRFKILGRDAKRFIDFKKPPGGPWQIDSERIGEFNRYLRGSIVIVADRAAPLRGRPRSTWPSRAMV